MAVNPENRPDPDTLLVHVQGEERQKHRGKLKIFLGYIASSYVPTQFTPCGATSTPTEQNKEGYYLALRKTQRSPDTEISAWLLFLLACLKKQKDNLTRKIERERVMRRLPDLSVLILEIVREHGPKTISQIQLISRANRNTLKVRLRELVDGGYLLKQGEGKGTRYLLGNRPF